MPPLYTIRTRARPACRLQQGSALIWALFFVAVTAGLLITNSWEMQANRTAMDVRYRKSAHARMIAQSALTDATAWFQRQSAQPVTTFAPKLDPEADPPLNETVDPTVGLVREFEVRGGLWARYEVRKDECLDVSSSYGETAGKVWDVGARGILFERVDASKPFNKAPNHVVGQQTLHTEVRGVPLILPASAALALTDAAQLTTAANVTLSGDSSSAAIAYKSNSGGGLLSNLLAALLGTVNGTPTGLVVPALSLTPQTLFRMRPARIEEFSDLVLQRGIYHNDRIVQDQLVYAAGELTVSPLAPLRGRMVLFVNGNFNAVAGNGSDLSGVLVVTGNTYIQGPFRLRGTLLTQGHVELGSGTGPVDILYDRASVQRVQQEIGKYRKSSSTRPNGTGGASTPVENLAADYTVMAAR